MIVDDGLLANRAATVRRLMGVSSLVASAGGGLSDVDVRWRVLWLRAHRPDLVELFGESVLIASGRPRPAGGCRWCHLGETELHLGVYAVGRHLLEKPCARCAECLADLVVAPLPAAARASVRRLQLRLATGERVAAQVRLAAARQALAETEARAEQAARVEWLAAAERALVWARSRPRSERERDVRRAQRAADRRVRQGRAARGRSS